jgi:hypothetical protein
MQRPIFGSKIASAGFRVARPILAHLFASWPAGGAKSFSCRRSSRPEFETLFIISVLLRNCNGGTSTARPVCWPRCRPAMATESAK